MALEEPVGKVRPIVEDRGNQVSVSIGEFKRGQELGVTVRTDDKPETPRLTLQRWSWQGELLGELPMQPGAKFSPDGQWAAVFQILSMAEPAATVVRAGGEARARVVGADNCLSGIGMLSNIWLADSSGFVVDVDQGYRILRTDGSLATSPAFIEGRFLSEPLPAPDRAIWAVGRTKVVDADGKVLQAANWDERQNGGLNLLDPWGDNSTELRFSAPVPGKDGICWEGSLPLPAKTEQPPFPAALLVAVGLPASDCVNLREQPGANGRAIMCIKGGSTLTVTPWMVPNPKAPEAPDQRPAVTWADGGIWVHVRTQTGQEGWISTEAAKLTWAP